MRTLRGRRTVIWQREIVRIVLRRFYRKNDAADEATGDSDSADDRDARATISQYRK